MRNISYFLVILVAFLTFSFTDFNKINNSEVEYYTCRLIGKEVAINQFLNIIDYNETDMYELKKYKNHYKFLRNTKELNSFFYDKESNILQSFVIGSTMPKGYGRYKMLVVVETDSSFTMKIISRGKTLTKLKGKSLIIECVKKK